jgi:uncharacterized membrane protein HdeD (DUF308 family)
MAEMLARNWWLLAVRGALAVVFGVLAWFWPDITLIALVLLFGAYVLVDGIFNLITAALGRSREPRWIVAIMGIASIIVGIATLAWPGLTAVALIYLIAAWAVTMGAFAIIGAIRLRREIADEWLLVIIGLLAIVFGVAIAIFPGAGALALVWLIGVFAVAYGVLQLSLAVRLRNWQRPPAATSGRDAGMATSIGPTLSGPP